jgi:hypothetical protein
VEKGIGGQEKSWREMWVLGLIRELLYIENVVECDED